MTYNLIKLGALMPLLASVALAATKEYDWTVSWLAANPDGKHERQVISINKQWPLPEVHVDVGDRVIVHLHNDLGDRNSSIHFHGLYQNGTNQMDGPPYVVQCPVPPGSSITYNFTVNQPGTYWYHSHVSGQYPNGHRAPFIVHDKKAPFAGKFDEELTITVTDWYYDLVEVLDRSFLSLYNPSGAEPVPETILLNDKQDNKISVKPNTTYLIHIMNVGALASQYFYIEDHDFEIVEVDGVYVEPSKTDMIYVSVAQRYSILLKTKEEPQTKNFPLVTIFDSTMFDKIEPHVQLNLTSWLQYNPQEEFPQAKMPVEKSEELKPFDDFELVPVDHMPLLPEPDHVISVTFEMNNLANGVNYAFFNNISYVHPKVPTLYTVLGAGELASDASIYGEFTHTNVLKHMDVIQLEINSLDTGTHPFHLHGHHFQVIHRSEAKEEPTAYDSNNKDFPEVPMRRDTVVVQANSNAVLRFRADNPGVWLFHCHLEWHLEQGLIMTFVEAPDKIRESISIPENHLQACQAAKLPYEGNAAANSDFRNLTSQNEQVAWLPAGFTPKGIVALVFSCISAFLGMGMLTWYGLTDVTYEQSRLLGTADEGLSSS